jgi:hypothetical protein
MNPQNPERKLTPAASQALENLLRDYKEEILAGAEESAINIAGEIKEISVHDIFSGAKRATFSRPSTSKPIFERLLWVYSALGLIIAVFGMGWFLFKEYFYALSYESRFPLLISLAGLVLFSLSVIFKQIRFPTIMHSSKSMVDVKADQTDYLLSFIRAWQEIELLLRDITSRRQGESKAKEPISIMVKNLVDSGKLSPSEANLIQYLLNTRNNVVHGKSVITKEELQALLNDIRTLKEHLSSR